MKHIPVGHGSLMAAGSRIMVAKAFHSQVPERTVVPDQQRFRERNPNVVHDKKAAPEVIQREVLGLLNGFSVILQAVEERGSFCGDPRINITLASSGGNGFANIDRKFQPLSAG